MPFDNFEEKLIFCEGAEPCPKKGTKMYEDLVKFKSDIEIILQTADRYVYQVAITMMKPPTKISSKPVIFPREGMVVGVFANKKIALLQSKYLGQSIDNLNVWFEFPKVEYVVAVGWFEFDRKKYQLQPGDVLVSEKIDELSSEHNIDDELKETFCTSMEHHPKFRVSESRYSKVDKGTITFMRGILDKYKVILISGVATCGDVEDTSKWEYTAAMAALQYAESKLKNSGIGKCKSCIYLTSKGGVTI